MGVDWHHLAVGALVGFISGGLAALVVILVF